MPDQKTEGTGLSDNVAGALCYVLGWVTGIIFLILEPSNKKIRFHAFQSIVIFGALFILNMIFIWVPVLNWLIGVVMFIFWIILIVMTYQERDLRIPVARELAERLNK